MERNGSTESESSAMNSLLAVTGSGPVKKALHEVLEHSGVQNSRNTKRNYLLFLSTGNSSPAFLDRA